MVVLGLCLVCSQGSWGRLSFFFTFQTADKIEKSHLHPQVACIKETTVVSERKLTIQGSLSWGGGKKEVVPALPRGTEKKPGQGRARSSPTSLVVESNLAGSDGNLGLTFPLTPRGQNCLGAQIPSWPWGPLCVLQVLGVDSQLFFLMQGSQWFTDC